MRHRHGLRKLNRTSSHRLAMLRNMTNSLLTHEVIKTTLPKAKELRRVAEPMITLGKTPTLANRRLAFDRLRDRDVVTKLFEELGPRYSARPGGYPHPEVRVSHRRQRADGGGRADGPPGARRADRRRRRGRQGRSRRRSPSPRRRRRLPRPRRRPRRRRPPRPPRPARLERPAPRRQRQRKIPRAPRQQPSATSSRAPNRAREARFFSTVRTLA